MSLRNVLLVDDDESLRQSLAEQLHLSGRYTVTGIGAAKKALELVNFKYFDVILLDIELPDMDGRDLCRSLRKKGIDVPIIILTAVDSDADTVSGLDAGANDYVIKPFRIGVLMARIRAHIREHEQSGNAVFIVGRYSFHPATRIMLDRKNNKKIRLTHKETAIIKYLYLVGEQAIDRDTLLGDVWGYTADVDTHTLETHFYNLRTKIERDPCKPEILVKELGGYRLAS